MIAVNQFSNGQEVGQAFGNIAHRASGYVTAIRNYVGQAVENLEETFSNQRIGGLNRALRLTAAFLAVSAPLLLTSNKALAQAPAKAENTASGDICPETSEETETFIQRSAFKLNPISEVTSDLSAQTSVRGKGDPAQGYTIRDGVISRTTYGSNLQVEKYSILPVPQYEGPTEHIRVVSVYKGFNKSGKRIACAKTILNGHVEKDANGYKYVSEPVDPRAQPVDKIDTQYTVDPGKPVDQRDQKPPQGDTQGRKTGPGFKVSDFGAGK
jgi:hypothetical protein